MGMHGIDHIELHVESLRQAQNLYARLFVMTVERSEALTADGWRAARDTDETVGLTSRRVVLSRGGLRLVLRGRATEFGAATRLGHIALRADRSEVERLNHQALELGCLVHRSGPDGIVFEDPYGVCWQVDL